MIYDCMEAVYSNEYWDFIVDRHNLTEEDNAEYCIQIIDANYATLFYRPAENETELNIIDYSYTAVPKCFGLLDQEALEASNILRVRDQPNLELTGQGVLFGIIDIGFDYTNPLFCHADGTTRIESIWNQEATNGLPPQGFLYGTEYSRSEINEALSFGDPQQRIPRESGHGTFLAALAAGSIDEAGDFSGAAPGCDMAFVHLKPAKQYLRDFYFIPDDVPAFQENDIMTAVTYLNQLATKLRKPLALCLALGTNMGNRNGIGALEMQLTGISRLRQRCVVVAAGNEAQRRHHFLGMISDARAEERVEISVSEGTAGFTAELWSLEPELYEVTILSPTGERFTAPLPVFNSRTVHRFLFENTEVSVSYRLVGFDNSGELASMRFVRPAQGVWTILTRARKYVRGLYHIWLPMEGMIAGDVFFLRPDPDTTITIPSDTQSVLAVGGYNTADNSIYLNSGRGYTVTNAIKPDLVAPAVEVYGPVANGRYGTMTGTSAAAALTAGAGALLLEWTGVRRNDVGVTGVNIKNYFIRGAAQDNTRVYPNKEYGWGRLDLYQVFENFRNA